MSKIEELKALLEEKECSINTKIVTDEDGLFRCSNTQSTACNSWCASTLAWTHTDV